LQAHRDKQFLRVAKSVARETRLSNLVIKPLQDRIINLGESPHQKFMQELLDRAQETSPGNKPGTIRDSMAAKGIYLCLRFLDALKAKAGAKNITLADCLMAILDPLLECLPEEQRTAPDGKTSRRCIEKLGEELGIKGLGKISMGNLKKLIKILTGVDLQFNNGGKAVAAAPSSDNPIPRTGEMALLHPRFESLQAPANRAAFAGFFSHMTEEAEESKNTSSSYATICRAMLFLEELEKEKDANGKPREIETELKKAFGGALNRDKTPVTDWSKWRTLTREQLTKVREELKQLPGIAPSNLSRYYPFIFHITGIRLSPGKPKASAPK
jgi:hypothetical protein